MMNDNLLVFQLGKEILALASHGTAAALQSDVPPDIQTLLHGICPALPTCFVPFHINPFPLPACDCEGRPTRLFFIFFLRSERPADPAT